VQTQIYNVSKTCLVLVAVQATVESRTSSLLGNKSRKKRDIRVHLQHIPWYNTNITSAYTNHTRPLVEFKPGIILQNIAVGFNFVFLVHTIDCWARLRRHTCTVYSSRKAWVWVVTRGAQLPCQQPVNRRYISWLRQVGAGHIAKMDLAYQNPFEKPMCLRCYITCRS